MTKIPDPTRGILNDTDAARHELLLFLTRLVAAMKDLDARITALEARLP